MSFDTSLVLPKVVERLDWKRRITMWDPEHLWLTDWLNEWLLIATCGHTANLQWEPEFCVAGDQMFMSFSDMQIDNVFFSVILVSLH